ncbi:MAG: hypothetical protein TUN42_02610 [Dehalogenimonas sp.]
MTVQIRVNKSQFLAAAIFSVILSSCLLGIVGCSGTNVNYTKPASWWELDSKSGFFQTNDFDRAQAEYTFSIVLPTYFPDGVKPYPYLIQGYTRGSVIYGPDVSVIFQGSSNSIKIFEYSNTIGAIQNESGSIFITINGTQIREKITDTSIEFAWDTKDIYVEVFVAGFNKSSAEKIIRSMVIA